MSLLNDVLRDLDQRAAIPTAETLHLPADKLRPAGNDVMTAPTSGLDVARWLSWMLVFIASTAAVWVYFQPTPDAFDIRPSSSLVTSKGESESATPVAAESSPVVARAPSEVEAVSPSAAPAGVTAAGSQDESAMQSVSAAVDTDVAAPQPTATVEPDSDQSSTWPGQASPSPSDQQTPAPRYLALRNTEVPVEKVRAASDVMIKTVTADHGSLTDKAQRQIDAGDLAAAEETLNRRLATHPGDRVARELQIGLLLRGGRYQDASDAIDSGLTHHPDSSKLRLIKARLLAQSGQVERSMDLLRALTEEKRVSREALQMLGALYQRQRSYAEAAEVYQRLIRVKSDDGAAWVGLAIALDGQGDAAALSAYRRALRLGGLPQPAERYARQRQSSLEANDG